MSEEAKGDQGEACPWKDMVTMSDDAHALRSRANAGLVFQRAVRLLQRSARSRRPVRPLVPGRNTMTETAGRGTTRPITAVAADLALEATDIYSYGTDIAKIDPRVLEGPRRASGAAR